MPDNFDTLLSEPAPLVRAIIYPCLLPVQGKLILGGQEKIGKSYIVLQMLRDLSTGGLLFGCPDFPIPEPVRSHYFEQEIGRDGLRERVKQLFCNVPPEARQRITFNSKDTALKLDGHDPAVFRELIGKLEVTKPEVTVFDPISKFHLSDENSSQQMGLVNKRLDYLSQTLGTATVIVHHYAKPSFEVFRERAYRLRGSTVLSADPDSILLVEMSQDTPTYRLWKVAFELRQMADPPKMFLKWDKKLMTISFQGWEQPPSPTAPAIPQMTPGKP